MSTPQYGKGSFDFEGDDMIYDVKWEVHDSEMECFVYVKGVEVTELLFDNVMDNVYDLAWDEHWGASA